MSAFFRNLWSLSPFLHVIDRIAVVFRICFDLDPLFVRLYGSSGCLGKLNYKNKPFTSVKEPLRGRKLQGQKILKPSISETFWTSSTGEMDNSTLQSRGSISSISTSNMAMDLGSGSSNISTEFVNHGFLLWTQTRQRWMGNKKPENRRQQLREPRLSWNASYESLLGSNKPFAQPVPLSVSFSFFRESFSCL